MPSIHLPTGQTFILEVFRHCLRSVAVYWPPKSSGGLLNKSVFWEERKRISLREQCAVFPEQCGNSSLFSKTYLYAFPRRPILCNSFLAFCKFFK